MPWSSRPDLRMPFLHKRPAEPGQATMQLAVLIVGLSVGWLTGVGSVRAEGAARAATHLHHELSVALSPEQHRLRATDRMTVTVDGAPSSFSWSLNPSLRVTEVRHQGRPLRWDVRPPVKEDRTGQGRFQQVTVFLDGLPGEIGALDLDVRYEGLLDDPPRESRQLRFVTPGETDGHIGAEGVYLSGETGWYPDVGGTLPTFTLHVTLPEGWSSVTHGRMVSRGTQGGLATEDWQVEAKTEALTLAANRFVQTHRAWQAPDGRSLDVATYLFPEDAALAEEYLDATVRYLEAYSRLLGPYPFPKFAVVENFFASGLGMPSFTLLGAGSIKRHYVQPYTLGHEIVHSWIGNWVLNGREQGNWVEGLTTYLANYYYDELTGKQAQARDQRRLMLLGYAVYVRSDEDYPVASFRQKTDQKDNAIGYQKTAMVFHQLRRELGEEVFWSAIRKLVADYGGTYAGWAEVEQVFATAGGKDLRWFFAQWIERPGAPDVTIAGARADRSAGTGYGLSFRIVQRGEPYRFRLRLLVNLAEGGTYDTWLDVQGREQEVRLSVPGVPTGVTLDPDFESFRRLPRERLSPMLNLYVTDRTRTVLLPTGEREASAPYLDLSRQVASREPAMQQVADREPAPADGSLLILGGPSLNRGAMLMRQACGDRVRLESDRFTVEGTVYEGPGLALLVSCLRPERPGSVVTLFYGLSPQAAAKVARLLFFYGWQSYVVFRDGAVVARGDWLPARENVEVPVDPS